MNEEFLTMATGPTASLGTLAESTLSLFADTAAFDATEFDVLREMIGEDGVMEMIEIFEAETRQRLRRLASGDQDLATQVREMHTLKGAAGTVAAPRLTALGRMFEQAAHQGTAPAPDEIRALDAALEAYLTEMRAQTRRRAAAA